MPWLPWHIFDASTLGPYVAVALALVAAPGPGQALVMARTLQGGARAGLLTSLGLNVGTLTHTVAAALGLSAVLMASATAFTVVKLLGAVYLLFLGGTMIWRSIREPSSAVAALRTGPNGNGRPPAHLFLHAVVTGILNPKVALFFFAFLPQFVRPSAATPSCSSRSWAASWRGSGWSETRWSRCSPRGPTPVSSPAAAVPSGANASWAPCSSRWDCGWRSSRAADRRNRVAVSVARPAAGHPALRR